MWEKVDLTTHGKFASNKRQRSLEKKNMNVVFFQNIKRKRVVNEGKSDLARTRGRCTWDKRRATQIKKKTCLIWVGLVLWHINRCWLFNAKSCFYIHIEYMICKHILFIQLNDQTVLFPKIQFSISQQS